MLDHVEVQLTLLNTLRTAECALVRSLVNMKHLVFFHDALGDKTLSTVGATIFMSWAHGSPCTVRMW